MKVLSLILFKHFDSPNVTKVSVRAVILSISTSLNINLVKGQL